MFGEEWMYLNIDRFLMCKSRHFSDITSQGCANFWVDHAPPPCHSKVIIPSECIHTNKINRINGIVNNVHKENGELIYWHTFKA
jgi:hypothetical protein